MQSLIALTILVVPAFFTVDAVQAQTTTTGSASAIRAESGNDDRLPPDLAAVSETSEEPCTA